MSMKKAAGLLAQQGRHGDTILAHINPREAGLLAALGGAGTRNPRTGLLEFYDDEGNDGSGSLSDAMDNASYNDAFSDPGYDATHSGLSYGGLTEMDITSGPVNIGHGQLSPAREYAANYGAAPANNSVGHSFSVANQDAWNDAHGNAMNGPQYEGFFGDLAAMLSRNGIYSQPGAGRSGLLDNVPVAGLLGGLLGPLNLIAQPAMAYAKGKIDQDPMAAKNTAKGFGGTLMGMLGGNILGAALNNPYAAQLGSKAAQWGYDKATTGHKITQADPVELTDSVLAQALPEAAQQAARTASAAGASLPFSIGAPQQSFLSFGSRRYG